MSNQFYHDLFLNYCINNNKRKIKKLMQKRPIDIRYYLKGMKFCIVLQNNNLLEWLYSRKGEIFRMDTNLFGDFITFAYIYQNYYIANWLVNQYKDFNKDF